MALAIDTKHLAEHWIPDHEDYVNAIVGTTGRFQLHRVYAHATVIHDPSTIRRLSEARGRPISRVKQAVLDWQADPDDELDEWEVFQHLKELAETSTSFPDKNDHTNATRPLVTSAQSPSFTARAQGRPPSSFHRYSVKISMLRNDRSMLYGMYLITHTDLQKVIPNVRHGSWCKWGYEPKIFCSNARHKCAVFWQMQVDFVDLLSRNTHPTSRLGKRRRAALNPFQQVSPTCVDDRSRVSHLPEAKRFKGVRYRRERKTWVAEMKPPGRKNKVSFGDFKSETEAACAVDAAFHHYGKTDHQLNFADTPRILSTLPTSAGLSEKDKLRLVKEQAKWLASIASTLPSTPTSPCTKAPRDFTSVPLEIPKLSGGCSAVPLGLRSFSEISSSLSCSSTDDEDDGVSQPQPWPHPDPTASIVANGVEPMEPSFAASDHLCVLHDFGEEHSMLQWTLENALADPFDIAITQRPELLVTPSSCGWAPSPARSSSSSLHITEQWDCPKHSSGFFTPFTSSPGVDQPSEFQRDSPFMSPPPLMFQMESPRDFHGGFPDRLLEQRSFGYE